MNPDANYTWAVKDGRAVLWIDIRFVKDQPIQQPKKPRVKSKERSLPKPPNSIVNDVIKKESRSTTADLTKDIKGEVIREVISVIAFPPAQAARSNSKAQQEDQENQAQIEYDDEAQEAPEEEEDHQDHHPSRKRPRAPTIDSDDQPLIPDRPALVA